MKTTLYLVLILILLSCQKKISEKTQHKEFNTKTEIKKLEKLELNDTIIYLSDDNDLALIKLTLIPNGTFDFHMSIYPETMQDSEPKPEIIKANGIWNGNKKTVLLNFEKQEKDSLNLNKIFDSNYAKENEFKVNNNTVEIDYSLDKLNIWGISCYKSKKENSEISTTVSTNSNSKFPIWIEKINLDINSELGQHQKRNIKEFNKINDSLSIYVFILNDGVCSKYSLVTFLNQNEIDNAEIGIECDQDMSIPEYKWKEFEFLSTTTFQTIEFSEHVNDSLIDNNGYIKEGYDFMESKTTIDSIIKVFEIDKTGKITGTNNE